MQAQTIRTEAEQPVARPLERGERHSQWTIALHWTSVLAIVVAAVSVLWRECIEGESLRTQLMAVHRQAGLVVFVALGLRLMVRFGAGMADHAGDLPIALRRAAHLAHLALYTMLFALPVLGLAVCSAHAVHVKLFGLIALPDLVRADPDLADTLTDYHLWAAWGLLFLVLAHVAAACWHHVVRRDGVLVAMLPVVERRTR